MIYYKLQIIVLIDFEKAFDKISWIFVMKLNIFFNFWNTYINFVNLLYFKPLCSVSNNGDHSEFIQIALGIRQRCPVSALLFLHCVKVLEITMTGIDHSLTLIFTTHDIAHLFPLSLSCFQSILINLFHFVHWLVPQGYNNL